MFISCGILSKLPTLSDPHFLHMESEDDHHIHLAEFVWGLSEDDNVCVLSTVLGQVVSNSLLLFFFQAVSFSDLLSKASMTSFPVPPLPLNHAS